MNQARNQTQKGNSGKKNFALKTRCSVMAATWSMRSIRNGFIDFSPWFDGLIFSLQVQITFFYTSHRFSGVFAIRDLLQNHFPRRQGSRACTKLFKGEPWIFKIVLCNKYSKVLQQTWWMIGLISKRHTCPIWGKSEVTQYYFGPPEVGQKFLLNLQGAAR